jgi:hypothetical protein
MPGPVARFDHRPDLKLLAPWPPSLRFRDGRTERILQNRLPPRPDNPAHALIGSSAGQAAEDPLAERG